MKTVVGICVVAGLLTTACDNSGPATTTSPTVAPASTTDTFSGTLAVGGVNTHTFTVSQVGTLNATLTSAGPPSTIQVGFGVGTFSNGVCSLVGTAGGPIPAGTSPQISGTASITGTWCVQIGDLGNLSGPITYSITVAHP